MSRLRLVTLIITTVALPLCASANGSSDVYPFPRIDTRYYNQYEQFQMQQGWHNDQPVWFISTDTDNLRTAFDNYFNGTIYWQGITLAPKLREARMQAAVMYVLTNYEQGPVFTAIPGEPAAVDYSGIWKVVFVTYKPDALAHAVTNTDAYDAVLNPGGLPSTSDADYDPPVADDATLVIDCPIVAVGPLGGQWYPAPPGSYRIRQAKALWDYTYTKMIWLPFWYVYSADPVSRRVVVGRVIMPDFYDSDLIPVEERIGPKIGANDAQGLCGMPESALQSMDYMRDPKPWNQYPIVADIPSNAQYPWRNANYDYSPLIIFYNDRRNINPWAVVNNPTFLDYLLTHPPLPATPYIERLDDTQRANAPVLPELPG